MKATWNGVTIAESDDTVVVEGNHYFPEASLKREYISFSNHRSSCPWKGQAYYYSLMVDRWLLKVTYSRFRLLSGK